MFELLILLHGALRATLRSRADVVAENLLLHQQLAVLTRPSRKRPPLRTRDKGGGRSRDIRHPARRATRRTRIGTASQRNHQYLRGLGADVAVDYTQVDWVTAVRQVQPNGVDAVLECVGGETLAHCFGSVRDHGRVAYIVEAEPPPRPRRAIQTHYFDGAPDGQRLAELVDLFDAGRPRVILEEVWDGQSPRGLKVEGEIRHPRARLESLSLVLAGLHGVARPPSDLIRDDLLRR